MENGRDMAITIFGFRSTFNEALALAGYLFKSQGSLHEYSIWQFLFCRSLRTAAKIVSFSFVANSRSKRSKITVW